MLSQDSLYFITTLLTGKTPDGTVLKTNKEKFEHFSGKRIPDKDLFGLRTRKFFNGGATTRSTTRSRLKEKATKEKEKKEKETQENDDDWVDINDKEPINADNKNTPPSSSPFLIHSMMISTVLGRSNSAGVACITPTLTILFFAIVF
jgi:hypothetical protein